ncbi:MAG: GNAT family N-acetyltransferase [Pseudomonadota bacterium]|nr:GNAT family N-acetyltransferase [Pseudomonadota bacterium]
MSEPPDSERATRIGERRLPAVRPAQAVDASSVARVFVDCWKEGYHGVMPTAYAASLSYEDQADAWRRMICMPGNATLVGTSQAGDVIAFLCGGPERSARSQYFAEIYGLYVLPEFRGCELGRRLLVQFCTRLLAIGLCTLTVRVVEANPIRGFYESMGAIEHDNSPVRIAGRSLNEVAYGWRDIRPLCRGDTTGNPT